MIFRAKYFKRYFCMRFLRHPFNTMYDLLFISGIVPILMYIMHIAREGAKDLYIVYNVNVGYATLRCIIPFGVEAEVNVEKQVVVFNN